MNKDILIIGAGGYIGKHLALFLAETRQVKAFVHGEIPQEFFGAKNIKVFKGDVFDEGSLASAMTRGDIVISLVGSTSAAADFKEHFNLNILAQGIILDQCAKKKVNKVIFLSSLYVYGNSKAPRREQNLPNPQDSYALTKALGEQIYVYYNKMFKVPAIVLRAGSVYGPHQEKGIFFSIMKSIRERKVVIIPRKSVYRDFIYIDDITEAIARSADFRARKVEYFNVCNSERISLRFLANMIQRIVKMQVKMEFTKRPPKMIAMFGRNERIKRVLRFAPKVSLDEGLKKTITSYYEKN